MSAIHYTPQAEALLQYLFRVNLTTPPNSDALNISALLAADYYGSEARIITANYGFDGYMGVPGLDDTGPESRQAAYDYGIAWQDLGDITDAQARAYYSGVGADAFFNMYGVPIELGDTIPVVFSHPVLGTSLDPSAFQIELNTGEIVFAQAASFLPNVEYNERQTVVLTGDWGNRLPSDDPDARHPVQVSIVATDTPLTLVTAEGLVSAVGFSVVSQTPYVEGNGPRMVGANLDVYSNLGEGAPLWLFASNNNSGSDFYGDEAQFRLRVYTSAGFSPDGVASILPTEYSRYFLLEAIDAQGQSVWIRESGVEYTIEGYGSIKVLGIADTGPPNPPYDDTYVEDHDNQYDIILSGDAAAIARLSTLHLPSAGDYSPVYNPGGPGNDPESNPPVPFTAPSSPQSIEISVLFGENPYVSFVEIDGHAYRDPISGNPIGADWGLAVYDTGTHHAIHQFMDPYGTMFYASFEVSPVFHIALDAAQPDTFSRATNDQIQGTAAINTVSYHGALHEYQIVISPEGTWVDDQVARRDGSDTLQQIERLWFADLALALDTDGHAGQAYSLYGLLDRAPDPGGLGYWIAQADGGATELQMTEAVMASSEYQALYANTAGIGEWLDALYLNVLDRGADAVGKAYWTQALLSQQMTDAQVAASFVLSAEHQALLQPLWQDGIVYDVGLA